MTYSNHRKALVKYAALVVLGPSIIRVFLPGTRNQLISVLIDIPFDEIATLENQDEYRKWWERRLDILAGEIEKSNTGNSRIYPGYKWGHAVKVLNLMMREIVLNSRYFPDEVMERVSPWLYCPIDSIVMKGLSKLDVALPFKQINQIDTPEKFYLAQSVIEKIQAGKEEPRIWFDDVWGGREVKE